VGVETFCQAGPAPAGHQSNTGETPWVRIDLRTVCADKQSHRLCRKRSHAVLCAMVLCLMLPTIKPCTCTALVAIFIRSTGLLIVQPTCHQPRQCQLCLLLAHSCPHLLQPCQPPTSTCCTTPRRSLKLNAAPPCDSRWRCTCLRPLRPHRTSCRCCCQGTVYRSSLGGSSRHAGCCCCTPGGCLLVGRGDGPAEDVVWQAVRQLHSRGDADGGLQWQPGTLQSACGEHLDLILSGEIGVALEP
jgi:hypothetical protein